jgi:Uma2 family endonuclease
MSATAQTTTDRLVTADDLLAMPDNARFELVEGNLVPMPPTSDAHGSNTNRLSFHITRHVYDNDLGECWAAETGFQLERTPDTVLAPGFAFIRKERLNYERTGRGYVPVVPDLVAETLSPSDGLTKMEEKMAQWLAFGVGLALLLDPIRKTLTLYKPDAEPVTLTRDQTFTDDDVLPGFTLPLAHLFPD